MYKLYIITLNSNTYFFLCQIVYSILTPSFLTMSEQTCGKTGILSHTINHSSFKYCGILCTLRTPQPSTSQHYQKTHGQLVSPHNGQYSIKIQSKDSQHVNYLMDWHLANTQPTCTSMCLTTFWLLISCYVGKYSCSRYLVKKQILGQKTDGSTSVMLQ